MLLLLRDSSLAEADLEQEGFQQRPEDTEAKSMKAVQVEFPYPRPRPAPF